MTLEILICTIDEGIGKVRNLILPPVENVSYLISFQYTSEHFRAMLPVSMALRRDVKVCFLPGGGLSKNRNYALKNATGDILLISDDDVRYEQKYFERILNVFRKHPDVDIACFQAVDYFLQPMKDYHPSSFNYKDTPKGSYFSSCEIAMRRESTSSLRFDERFGLGSKYLASGEEEILLYQAFLSGLNIEYFPIVIVQTDRNTTGSSFFSNKRVRRSKGAVLFVMHGFWGALLRCLKFSFLCRKEANPFIVLWNMMEGILYIWKKNLKVKSKNSK